jgi:hypothetical protein
VVARRYPPTRGLADDEEGPEPPSPTGLYPGPVWDDSAPAATATAFDDEEGLEPPSPTGLYPGPVWDDNAPGAPPTTATAYAADVVTTAAPLNAKEPDYTEEIGDAEDLESAEEDPSRAAALGAQEMYRIIREVALADSGTDLYSAVLTPPLGSGPGPGLAFGLLLFTQESGRLGSVLRLMQKRDPALFSQTFGADAPALLATTSAATSAERLNPVGGKRLWEPEWVEKFKRAGALPAFQAAQNEEAIEGQFRPLLAVAMNLGATTDRTLAMVYDRVVTRGLGGGLRWVVRAAGPLRMAAQREHALEILGFDTVSDFQQSMGWLRPDGRFGPETHAALVGAVRRQGILCMPTPADLAARLVAAATGAARGRLTRLRDSVGLTDQAYQLV